MKTFLPFGETKFKALRLAGRVLCLTVAGPDLFVVAEFPTQIWAFRRFWKNKCEALRLAGRVLCPAWQVLICGCF